MAHSENAVYASAMVISGGSGRRIPREVQELLILMCSVCDCWIDFFLQLSIKEIARTRISVRRPAPYSDAKHKKTDNTVGDMRD